MTQKKKNLLTVAEFAQYEDVDVRTVKRWIKSDKTLIIKVRADKGHSAYSVQFVHLFRMKPSTYSAPLRPAVPGERVRLLGG
jgi:predicted DNA-binding transcriptional regulator YafY